MEQVGKNNTKEGNHFLITSVHPSSSQAKHNMKILLALILFLITLMQATTSQLRRMIKGVRTEDWEFPYLVSLEVNNVASDLFDVVSELEMNESAQIPGDGVILKMKYQSGGVISRNFVITMLGFLDELSFIDCHFGINNPDDRYMAMRVHRANILTPTPVAGDYDEIHNNYYRRSVALLKLPERLSFTHIKPLTLPPVIGFDESYKIVELAGYGMTENETSHWGSNIFYPNVNHKGALHKMYMRVIKPEECHLEAHFKEHYQNFLCADPVLSDTGPCLGDEGSPVVVRKHGQFILLGLLVRVRRNCETPVVFIRINYKISWIDVVVNGRESKKDSDETRPWSSGSDESDEPTSTTTAKPTVKP